MRYAPQCFLSPVIFCLLLVAGCSSSEVKCYPATGSVTVQQRPATGAVIILHPRSEDLRVKQLRPYGTVDSSGRFALNCLGQEDGAPAGEYAVTIQWEVADPMPGSSADPEAAQMVPDRLQGRYSNPATTDLKVIIREESNELPPIAL